MPVQESSQVSASPYRRSHLALAYTPTGEMTPMPNDTLDCHRAHTIVTVHVPVEKATESISLMFKS